MTNWRKISIAGATAALMLGAAACGTQESGAEKTAAGAAAPAAAQKEAGGDGYGDGYGSGDAAAGASAKKGGPVAARQDAKLGAVVTDSAGFTLYRFDKDTASPSTSACAGDCAKTWPPVPAGAAAGTGIDAARLGSLKRADGTSQLTVAGWPVYRFAKDTAPGQTNGQGVGGTWFAVTPEGKKAGQQAEPPAEKLPALSVVRDGALGEIVRDGKGRTLYRFTKDTAWPMKSNCKGACLDTWKPAKMVDVKGVEGIDPKKVIPFNRPDGTVQLTIDCWPLYWFTGDKAPGDTSGQGVGGTWFAVTPQGKLAK